MKKLKIMLLVMAMTVSSLCLLNAQGNANFQSYGVHEDVVLPSMVGEYESATKELVSNIDKHGIKELKWITAVTSDFRYLYLYPIANMAELDKDNFKLLADKMGADKMGALFTRMNKCYNQHSDYVLRLSKDLTYMPSGITLTPEGQNYRRFYYLRFTPQQEEGLVASLKAVKDMFQKKNSKMYYRVYRSGFGSGGDYFLVAIAGKDVLAYETMGSENDKLLGEEAGKVFGEMMKNLSKMEEIAGNMRPDLAPAVK
jgi:hypothetical protein